LKSVWENGEWIVKIIFMDHDDLDIAGKNSKDFYPRAAFQAIADDELHIFGGLSCGRHVKGEVEFLQEIYRVSEQVGNEGVTALREAIKDAYKRTQHELINSPKLRAYFHESFIERIFDWDRIVAKYLETGGDSTALDLWEKETKEFLSNKGYTKGMIYDCLCAVDSSKDLLARYSLIY